MPDGMGGTGIHADDAMSDTLPVHENAAIYFGGGTPTILSAEQIGRIVESLKAGGFWRSPAEATIEANPGTVDSGFLKKLRQLGFDRISLGVQSLQDNELSCLGRVHSAAQALEAIQSARDAGFSRVSADLMYGIPKQTPASWRDTLDRIIQLGLSHVSAYGLIVEEGTPLYRLAEEGRAGLPEEDDLLAMYETAVELLPKHGLLRYEVSNYGMPGQESLHNKVYWHYEPYAAFGAGACSFTGTKRLTNTADINGYIEAVRARKNGRRDSGAEQEELSPVMQLEEAMIMGLRLTEGVYLPAIRARFGVDPREHWRRELAPFLAKGMLEQDGDFLRLTPYGMRFGNEVFAAFV